MKVKIYNASKNELPKTATALAAGFDLKASMAEGTFIEIRPGERKLIPTGLHMEIEPGYEGQVRPRSGLALKAGLTVLNAPGTIDADYRGEVGVILVNHSTEKVFITNGDRIAQIVFAKVEQAQIEQVDSMLDLSETERGGGGFGSTGKA